MASLGERCGQLQGPGLGGFGKENLDRVPAVEGHPIEGPQLLLDPGEPPGQVIPGIQVLQHQECQSPAEGARSLGFAFQLQLETIVADKAQLPVFGGLQRLDRCRDGSEDDFLSKSYPGSIDAPAVQPGAVG